MLYRTPWRIELTVREGVPRLVSDGSLTRAADRALVAGGAPSPGAIGLIFTDDREIEVLNRSAMGHDGPTDVLSFPLLPAQVFPSHPAAHPVPVRAGGPQAPLAPGGRVHLGEIVISVERAIEQAEQGRGGQTGDVRWQPADELRLLVTHGVLHICGWDHAEPVEEAAMRELEKELLAR